MHSMTIWRDAGRVSFASAQDFMDEDSISQNCRKSYEDYILSTDGAELPKNDKGYTITEWSYVDNEHNARYVATWSKDFSWGVMKTPIPKKQTEAKSEEKKEAIDTKDLKKSSTKTEDSLAIIATELTEIKKFVEIIAGAFADKTVKPASEL